MGAHEQPPRERVPTERAHAGDEINELRKFIVDMMHSEVELMERIKQREESIDAVNARVERFKNAIQKEQARNNELKRALATDLKGLQLLEEKRALNEAKQKQLHDAIATRSAQVQQLHQSYQSLRAGMVALRVQTARESDRSEQLARAARATDAAIAQARIELDEPTPLDEINSERQTLRAKQRFVIQHSAQIQAESNALVEKNTQLAGAQTQTHVEIQELQRAIRSEENEAERNRQRLLRDTAALKTDNERSRSKLKTKRTKLRSQLKNEMASLRRRITFVSSELERAQMTNEDVYSVVGALQVEQDALDAKLHDLCEDIRCKEATIAEVEAKARDFDRSDAHLSTANMQHDLDTKSAKLHSISAVVRENEAAANAQQAEIDQLAAKLSELNTVAARTTTSDTSVVDAHIAKAKAEISELEARNRALSDRTTSLTTKTKQLENETRVARARNTKLGKELARLYSTLSKVNVESERVAAKLAEQQLLQSELDKAMQQRNQCHADAIERNSRETAAQQDVDHSAREHEQRWKRKCLDEEAKLEAVLQEWDDKIRQTELHLDEIRVH